MPSRNPNVLKNLKHFKKGAEWTGNKHGAPKKIPSIEKLLAEVFGAVQGEEFTSEAKEILEALKKAANKGNVRASEIILDRMYGKPKQEIKADLNVTDVSLTKFKLNTKKR